MTSHELLCKLLYNDKGCNHDLDDIMKDIVRKTISPGYIIQDLKVDRWNIYQPSSLHIVFACTLIPKHRGKAPATCDQVIVPMSEFTSRYRDIQLSKLDV